MRLSVAGKFHAARAFPEISRAASRARYRDVKSIRTGLHLRPECCLRVSTLVRGIPFTSPARTTACRRLTIRSDARCARVVATSCGSHPYFSFRGENPLDSPNVSTSARDIDPWRYRSLRNSRISNDTGDRPATVHRANQGEKDLPFIVALRRIFSSREIADINYAGNVLERPKRPRDKYELISINLTFSKRHFSCIAKRHEQSICAHKSSSE